MGNYCLLTAIAIAVTTPCAAATLPATPATLVAVFNSARPGDLISLTGKFGAVTLADRDFGTNAVKISGWAASFTGTVNLKNVTGVTLRGGSFSVDRTTGVQRAISVYQSRRVTVDMVSVEGDGGGQGVIVYGGSTITVKNGSYRKLRIGVGYIDVAGGTISGNTFTAMASDGINITGSSNHVTASTNRCQLPEPTDGAHPDCIQMWSDVGKPQLSDITITANNISGETQGITLFDRGGQRIVITNNIINTSYPQGIACSLCDYSRITGNTLTTLPGARWRTVINATGVGLVLSNNTIGLRP